MSRLQRRGVLDRLSRDDAVGVVGGDFGEAEWDVFRRHNINTSDVEVVPDGQAALESVLADPPDLANYKLHHNTYIANGQPKPFRLFTQDNLLDLANLIRQRLQEWREREYAGATKVTRELLELWRSPDRSQRLLIERLGLCDIAQCQRYLPQTLQDNCPLMHLF